jgi:uncharacterized protein YggU (UPF0235/DUF167 family)
MSEHKGKFSDPRTGSAVGIRVITRCAATELVGKNKDGSIEVRLKAPSAGSEDANSELINFLAQKLGVAPSAIEVVLGAGEREKIISIEGVNASAVDERLFPA